MVRQDQAKAILATKICTHFNRIRCSQEDKDRFESMAGGIKNNVLMIGPTGVGKTYIIKLIAAKLGVPFVKGDATKFSETGYVGGDVEDLVRDLVREADDDIELAQYGIIYIDEIDKIASARNLIGADVSRTGVQRALLKPMEETDVELKVPHDPVSMMQEIERFRKTGKREKVTVNTKNVLFIMSGAFTDLVPIIQRRLSRQGIGFGARITAAKEQVDILTHVKAEDLIEFGFESEFVGRLPVKAVFDHLGEEDLYQILKNPNNPIILGKKLDFAAYGIDGQVRGRLPAPHGRAGLCGEHRRARAGQRDRKGPARLRTRPALLVRQAVPGHAGDSDRYRRRPPAHGRRRRMTRRCAAPSSAWPTRRKPRSGITSRPTARACPKSSA